MARAPFRPRLLAAAALVGAGLVGGGSAEAAPRVVGSGSLSRAQISGVIHRHLARVKHCYARTLARDPRLRGRLVVKFIIGKRGRVIAARVRSSRMRPRKLGRVVGACVVQQVRSWRFPRPRGGGTVAVVYPFIFRPAGSSSAAIAAALLPNVRLQSLRLRGKALAPPLARRFALARERGVQRCYARALTIDKKLHGRVDIALSFDQKGRVRRASVKSRALAGGARAREASKLALKCLRGALSKWRLPRGPLEMVVPWVLGHERKHQGFLRRWRKHRR